jgi:hypothetical protein
MAKGCNFIAHSKFLMIKVLALIGFKLKALIFMYHIRFLRVKVKAL